MHFSKLLVPLVAYATSALAAPLNATDLAVPVNVTELAGSLDRNHIIACENVDWMVPCQQLLVYPGGFGTCLRIPEGSIASRAKSFILPSANRFPAWECRFHSRSDCTGMDSCYIRDMRRDSGCRFTYRSYWCIDDL